MRTAGVVRRAIREAPGIGYQFGMMAEPGRSSEPAEHGKDDSTNKKTDKKEADMTDAALLLLGLLLGFWVTVFHERLARLREFRAKIMVWRLRFHETPDDGLAKFYESTRLEVLEACAIIKEDVSRRHRRRFHAACATYCTAQQDDHARMANAFVNSLYPGALPLHPDQRTLKERLCWAFVELGECANPCAA